MNFVPPKNVPEFVEERTQNSPLLSLDEAELEFVLTFVLASGSLKEMAQTYGVSYPTMRAKLDRLIARLDEILQGCPVDPMSELLAKLVERGEIGVSTAQAIRTLHRERINQQESAALERFIASGRPQSKEG